MAILIFLFRRKRVFVKNLASIGSGPGKPLSGFFLDTRPCCNAATDTRLADVTRPSDYLIVI